MASQLQMNRSTAAKIARLINDRNQLDAEYDADRVLGQIENYVYELDGKSLVACVEVKKVQWYQSEICHLSVSSDYERQGHGTRMIQKAEEKAVISGARIVQCTIRIGNDKSERAFSKQGYERTTCFYNARTQNYVAVWQKVVSHR